MMFIIGHEILSHASFIYWDIVERKTAFIPPAGNSTDLVEQVLRVQIDMIAYQDDPSYLAKYQIFLTHPIWTHIYSMIHLLKNHLPYVTSNFSKYLFFDKN